MIIPIKRAFNTVFNRQYPCPQGMIGSLAGELMVRQHATETVWTVSVADVQPADSVLEIGFGAGKAIALLADKTPDGSVAGVDLSATMVRRARTRNAQAVRAGQVLLQQGDAAQLPFANQQFDKVISIHSFYFWPEHAAVFAEIFRVLKPGGTCVVTFSTGKAGEAEAMRLEMEIEEQWLAHMRRLGFTEVQFAQGPVARQFKNVAIIGRR